MFKNKKNIISIIFLSIICIVFTFFGITYAKYISNHNDNNGAGTAKFNVTANVSSTQATSITVSNEITSATYNFTVKSSGEVSVKYDVIVTLPQALPSGITLKVDGSITPVISNANLTYTFSNVGSFEATGGTKNHTLNIYAENLSESLTITDIIVDVYAVQKI